ncbi:O-antigen polymerase [Actinacidiphila bryophytorum]|uniref:O-antigen polymerase n=1 Tax=Actinacidiphila bryophytorum TaxID=1436133 RepID=UPI002176DB11|nr:O-antigen polymerase [Actinacidiphila bryophytorum]UWE08751.1 oligosaccharide repeat unit polymerase [Actinacidiphila bryophytorum]
MTRSVPRAALSRALAVPLALALVAFLPGYVTGQPGPGGRDAAYWLQLTLTVYAGGRLAAMVLTRRRRLIQGAFWLFVYVAMGVAPLAQEVIGQVPTPVLGPRSDTTTAITLVLVGCVAFDVGALLARHRPAARVRKARPSAQVSRRRLWLLIAVAYVGSAISIAKLGGPAVFFNSRQAISEASGGGGDSHVGSAFVRGFGTVPALLAMLFLVRWMITSRVARRTPLAIAALGGLVVVNAVVNNPVSNPRYWFLTVVFSLIFTAFPRSPVMYRAALVTGVVAALVLFPFLDRFRYDSGGYHPVESTSVLEPLTIKDYDQVGMFANTLTFVHAGHGHTHGRQLAADVFFFVPRSVWHGKPLDSGVQVGQWMGMTNTNLSSPLWAELWLDFGPVGMAGGFLALGYLCARGDRRYAQRTLEDGRPGTVMAVVIPLVCGYSFILLRGPLLQASGRIGIAAVCLALVTTFSEDRRKILR